jgi:hypothetical protein
VRSALALGLLALAACSAPSRTEEDAGTPAQDAGPLTNGPLPAPLFRMADVRDGTSHTTTATGLIAKNGPATDPPTSLGVTPASQLDISDQGGTLTTLYFTMPVPFRFPIFPNDTVKFTFKEVAGTANAPHSYGVLLTRLTTGALVTLAEDGASGSAFTATERLGFDFQLDTQVSATLRETVDCGDKAHYPGYVSVGGRTVHLYPGESTVFSVNSADLKFTLLDLYRFENSSCGAAPEYSIAYIVQPN